MAEPAGAEQPGLGLGGGRGTRGCESAWDEVRGGVNGGARKAYEVVEVGSGGEGVERSFVGRVVLSKVGEDVWERVADGARRGERAPVPAIGPKLAPSKDEAVDGPRDANGEAAQARAEGTLVERFYQEVDVLGLHGDVDDAKRTGARRFAAAMARRTVGKTYWVRSERSFARSVT